MPHLYLVTTLLWLWPCSNLLPLGCNWLWPMSNQLPLCRNWLWPTYTWLPLCRNWLLPTVTLCTCARVNQLVKGGYGQASLVFGVYVKVKGMCSCYRTRLIVEWTVFPIHAPHPCPQGKFLLCDCTCHCS